jgi:uncharacterized protein YndB with AHSA1/START domain
MTRIINQIIIDRPIEAVFDLVTTARFWPQWHPATTGVSGATEQPMALGDVIREEAQIGGHSYAGNWTVVEHVRPMHVVLRGGSGQIEITYTFRDQQGQTELVRQLEYQPENFGRSAPDANALQVLMDRQSAEALHKLKILVEGLLHDTSSGA